MNDRTHTVYVTNNADGDSPRTVVTVLDGSRCNATATSGCGAPPHEEAVGSQPVGLAIDPHADTVYVIDTFQAGSMSILASDLGPQAAERP